MRRHKVDLAKDAIDAALGIDGRRSERTMKDRLASARDIIEYIELHYISDLDRDLEERRYEKRTARHA